MNGVANLAIVTMLVLLAQGVHSFVREPDVITNTTSTVRILTNDSFIVVKEQLARTATERDAAQALAAERGNTIAMLAPPLQKLTDSLLTLQRGAGEVIDAVAKQQAANVQERGKLEAARLARYNTLYDRVDDLPTRGDMTDMLRAHQPVIFFPDTPRIGLVPPPAKARWGLQIEPFVEAGFTPQNLQPTFRAGGRVWLRKQNPRPHE